MGLQDRDYYGEKYWKLIEEEPPRPPRREFIVRPSNNFGRNFFRFQNLLSGLIGIVVTFFLLIQLGSYLKSIFTSKIEKSSIKETFQLSSGPRKWKVGETIKRGNFEYTLEWVKTWPMWVSRESYIETPRSGFKFVVMKFTAKNIGFEKATPEHIEEIRIKTKDGYWYKAFEGENTWKEASPSEREKYFCEYFIPEAIYPNKTITGCEVIGIHQEKEPGEIYLQFLEGGSWSVPIECKKYVENFELEKLKNAKKPKESI